MPVLRLGRNITWSYFSDEPRVQLPLHVQPDGLLTWALRGAIGEWRTLSVDGDVYLRAEVEAMARAVAFRSPNTFELALSATSNPVFEHRRGVRFAQSRVVNLPLNRVQAEFDNRAGTLAAEVLLGYWQQGLRIEVEALYGAAVRGMHELLPLGFAARDRGRPSPHCNEPHTR